MRQLRCARARLAMADRQGPAGDGRPPPRDFADRWHAPAERPRTACFDSRAAPKGAQKTLQKCALFGPKSVARSRISAEFLAEKPADSGAAGKQTSAKTPQNAKPVAWMERSGKNYGGLRPTHPLSTGSGRGDVLDVDPAKFIFLFFSFFFSSLLIRWQNFLFSWAAGRGVPQLGAKLGVPTSAPWIPPISKNVPFGRRPGAGCTSSWEKTGAAVGHRQPEPGGRPSPAGPWLI